MRLDELTGRRVVLLGLGADVRAAVPPVVAAGPADVRVVEAGPAAADLGLPVVTLEQAAADGEVFVRSPGFPRYEVALVEALARGARMTTPLDLWVGSVGVDRTVVGITGTKGKSTVTSLVGVLAERAGMRIGVAGNLGIPVFADGWDAEAPVVVLEISSYQAADLHHPPDVAVVTFLSEDHLSWHGGVDRYVADKLRVVRNDGGTASRVLVPAHGGGAAISAISALGPPAGDGGEAVVLELVEPPTTEDRTVPTHRIQNAALAAAVLAAVGGPVLGAPAIVDAARTSLPGRLDACPAPGGVLALDDALASNPSAAAAGLAWLRSLDRPTVVLLGGLDRGADVSPLGLEAARWPTGRLLAIGLPDSGSDLARRSGIEVVGTASDVADAVHLALRAAGPDGVVILSPGAPTPPVVGNWQTRSDQFRSALAAAVAVAAAGDG